MPSLTESLPKFDALELAKRLEERRRQVPPPVLQTGPRSGEATSVTMWPVGLVRASSKLPEIDEFWPFYVHPSDQARPVAIWVYLKSLRLIAENELSVPIVGTDDVVRLVGVESGGKGDGTQVTWASVEFGSPDIPKNVGADTDRVLTTNELARALDLVSWPERDDNIRLPFNPDDFPLF